MKQPQKPHWSKSSLKQILSLCARQWELQRVEKRPYSVGIKAHVGTATHAGIEDALVCSKATGELAPFEHAEKAAVGKLEIAIKGETMWTDEERLDTAAATREAEAKVRRLLTLWYRELGPTITPTHIERAFRLSLPGPRDLVGYIDIQTADAIIDTKTTGRSPADDLADLDLELTVYALAVATLDSVPPPRVELHYLVDAKKEPKVKVLSSTRGKPDFEDLMRRINVADRMVDAGVFPPASPDAWICNSDWCPYWQSICEYGRRRRVQV